jgi:uncharacterized protein with LGFP repeats
MRPSRSRYVTACQQLLALGVVVVALAPATSVVSLDVVGVGPEPAPLPSGRTVEPDGPMPTRTDDFTAYAKETTKPSEVPAEPVDAVLREVPLTPAATTPDEPSAERRAEQPTSPKTTAKTGGRTEIVSEPQDVEGYGAVGVTWDGATEVPEEDIALQVRTLEDGTWSGWSAMQYNDDHGPDPDSEEARKARPGTDEALVGDVDQVQVRVTVAEDGVPADMKLAVVGPGEATETESETPAIDTNELESPVDPAALLEEATAEEPEAGEGTDDGAISLQKAVFTPKPQIYSRAQWGADEKMREKSALHYGEVHGGFVHHTVNANEYTRAEVPGILRSIYAYHVRSRGWSDIGYNYLVDRFGRIWEGRYGGVDRAVVGAHTLNYNDYSFAMSAIGNFELVKPSKAMLQAYGALFAWKLSLHGVSAASTSQQIGARRFQAVNGHRDAASTACPGKYLYAKIPKIRKLAAAAQQGWSGRELESNLAGSAYPDLILRRASDGRGVIFRTGGLLQAGTAVTVSTGWTKVGKVVASPDLTGDKRADLLVVGKSATVRPGAGSGTFGDPVASSTDLLKHSLLTAVGDLNGDKKNDVVGRLRGTGYLDVFLGNGHGKFKRVRQSGDWSGYNLLSATGDVTGDGKVDLVARDGGGHLWIHPGTGTGALAPRKAVAGTWSGFDAITGFGDFDGDGRADLFVRRRSDGLGYVMPGGGNGTFGVPRGPMTGVAGVAGLTGGGNIGGTAAPDLLARSGDRLVRFINPGTKDLDKPIVTNLDLSTADRVMNAGDWDRDGFGDVITRSTAGALHLHRGDGKGRFAAPVVLAGGFAKVSLLAAVGDMTGDGFPDLMGQPSGSSMRIFPGVGTGGFRTSYPAYGRITASRQLGIGRWNADGAPDVLARNDDTLRVYPGNGPGGLTGSRTLSLDLAPYNWVLGVSDTRIYGHPDLILRERKTGYLWLLQASDTGFAARRFLGGAKGYDLAG